MAGRAVDLTGEVFTRLKVIRRVANKGIYVRWMCICRCGKRVIVGARALVTKHTRSCGCLKTDNNKLNHYVLHGMSKTPEFKVWFEMVQRCTNPKSKSFKFYGARGIKVCILWQKDFAQFIQDMGRRPDGCWIERIDNDGPYDPSNCRWSTPHEQFRNRRRNIKASLFGREMILKDWATLLGAPYSLVTYHVRVGKTLEEALKVIRGGVFLDKARDLLLKGTT